MAQAFRIRTAEWPHDADALRAIRHEVFVCEQSVPAEIEWDGRDPECLHALAEIAKGSDPSPSLAGAAQGTSCGQMIGCGRLLPDGHIGRMAVRREWRGRGVGGGLLLHLIALAERAGHSHVVLNAQSHALGFYRRYGFEPKGEEFMEAGITHQAMQRTLGPLTRS